MDLEDLLDSRVDVVFAWRFAMEDLDGERSTGDGKGRSVAVEVGELR
jgi:hypothetical protein